jgi:cell division septation protein DedD
MHTYRPALGHKTLVLVLFLSLALAIAAPAATTIDPTNKYAWAANLGFTNWRPSDTDGVAIADNFCSGYIYAANVGWISMGSGSPSNGVSYSNSSASDFGVNCSAGGADLKLLRGFAYGANIGWVNFEATGNPRVILSTGQLRGFAWSANCGWINLDDANVFVATAPQSSPAPSPTPTATPTATATATATAPATATATATATVTASPTPTATATASPIATPSATPTPDSQLGNISTRMRVEAGDNILIAGFIVQGNGDKRLIIRAVGPTLATFGVGDALQDPTLELHDSSGGIIASNDDWAENGNATEIVASGLVPANVKESALLVTIPPGAYTAVLRGKNNSTGVGLVEVYDLDTSGAARAANISTRGFVLTGENVMIGGLIVTGNDPSQFLLRAIGPSLENFGVPSPLADPFLELHDGNGVTIFSNNNWRETQEAAIQNTGLAPSDNLESAILISLVPGNYTAVLKGADGGTGNGLVEVYKLN